MGREGTQRRRAALGGFADAAARVRWTKDRFAETRCLRRADRRSAGRDPVAPGTAGFMGEGSRAFELRS